MTESAMRLALTMLMLVVGCAHARAQGARVDRAEIVEVGIFRADTAATERAPGTATGQRHVLAGATLVTSTTRIDAKVGLHFGMQFRVIGKPDKAPVRLTSVTHYPAPGLKAPDSGAPMRRGENMLSATIGTLNYRGYVFDQDWEIVPGTWTFELWDGKRMLAKQAFEVVRP